MPAVDGSVKPVAEGLFTTGEQPRLIASECRSCGAQAFPARRDCLRCRSTEVTECLLPGRGVLWSWTVQAFRPVSPPYAGPAEFTPFGVGYVELGSLCVETIVELPEEGDLAVGTPMEMFLLPLDLGREIAEVTYAFRAVRAA